MNWRRRSSWIVLLLFQLFLVNWRKIENKFYVRKTNGRSCGVCNEWNRSTLRSTVIHNTHMNQMTLSQYFLPAFEYEEFFCDYTNESNVHYSKLCHEIKFFQIHLFFIITVSLDYYWIREKNNSIVYDH